MDEERIRKLSAEYDELKERQEALLDELKQVQQRMGELMLQIIDVTRE
jgi:predicted  nucleic acid-binding Zn-ribbon protein